MKRQVAMDTILDGDRGFNASTSLIFLQVGSSVLESPNQILNIRVGVEMDREIGESNLFFLFLFV